MRVLQAFRAFWQVLVNREFAELVRQLAQAGPTPAPALTPSAAPGPPPTVEPKAKKPATAARSEAITLLATLQRDARFIDIVMEPLATYSDAQIGAAARDVLRDCGKTLERLFSIEPIVVAEEGAAHETPADVDAGRYRLTGNVSGDPPYRGQLVHHGWQATRCDLPKWSGRDDSALILAPVELELV